MEKRLTLHIQQNTTLDRFISILTFLNEGETDIDRLAGICQVGVPVLQKLIFPFLRSILILSKKTPPQLTPLGKVAATIQLQEPSLLGDFLHLLLYSLHFEEPNKRFSWAYATLVRQLWLRKEVILSSAEKKFLVGQTIDTASHKFEISASDIAFSESSVAGGLNWLRSLSPNVLESEGKLERFNRRYFCAAPIVIKAADSLYRYQQRSYGVRIFLREDIQERLCQMLLLDPSGLENTLENAKQTYDYDRGGLFDWGYEGGYGQWVMLTESPEWTQLL
ncbi:hypothetical protein [Oscillatoria sp. FACHB-1406]|uniref:hypothetical protein n=1 Tax=Oscillatoria sp. FACHB-1406 TaxID=2692846 RepID=UPI0016856E81|nr:hypothetical protein [Oscillatoria sp. FACHB-1406]MBD2580167.1 hypothetical protein [Oscillatoria sp. FACHB-1406]